MDLAPIVLFAYNRLDTLQQTVAALQNNDLAAASELYVFADGPKTPGDAAVAAVHEYVQTITGFAKVTVAASPINQGCAPAVIAGITDIVNRCGKIIVVEDDIVTSPYFLRYMNDALNLYADEEGVACISGYVYPVDGVLPPTFFMRSASAWGWATWKRAWAMFEPDGSKLLAEIKRRKLGKEFDFQNTVPYLQMLNDQIKGNISAWDIRWYASIFLLNKLCLFPGQSLVQNIGFTENGTHCSQTDAYNVNMCTVSPALVKIPIEESNFCRLQFTKFFKKTFRKKFYHCLFHITDKNPKTGKRTLVFLNVLKITYKSKQQ